MKGLDGNLSPKIRQRAAAAAERAAGLRRNLVSRAQQRTAEAATLAATPAQEPPSRDPGEAKQDATPAQEQPTADPGEAKQTATLAQEQPPSDSGEAKEDDATPAREVVLAERQEVAEAATPSSGAPPRAWRRVTSAAGLLRNLPLRAWQRGVAAGGLAALLLLGGAMAAGAWASGPSDQILAGVKVDGLDVGGMTRSEATKAVEAMLKPSLNRPIMITVGKKRFRMTPSGVGRGRAVDQAVAEALAGPRLSALGSFWHKVIKRPVTMDIHVKGTRQDERVAAYVARVAKQVAVAPVDAVLEMRDGAMVKRKARTGRALDQDAATKALVKVLGESGRTEARLPLQAVAPKVADKDIGQTIEIDKSVNRLWLYQGMKVVKSYRVATAMSGYVTPSGSWKVAYKEVNPTWNNPAPTTWGKDMPLVIPPGPGNPLGTRALGLTAPAILIHGSYATGSIGGYASHGCIRMTIWDAEDIFPRVKVGTRVLIHR
jgi:lipoprotein-anchoring transpeptidase ErfK/SrfK